VEQSRDLSSIYRRIRKKCCGEWEVDAQAFRTWYDAQLKKQKRRCHYCQLPGNTKKRYGKWFRKGRRGRNLEVDRIDNGSPYSPENCVLACYPCNNAKSDVFSYQEFLQIGEVVNRVKTELK
jgi:5-methylcytosine-specific restriction endonuclease McrA